MGQEPIPRRGPRWYDLCSDPWGVKPVSASGLWLVSLALVIAALVGCETEGAEEAPIIPWWAQRPHADRGPCTRCHQRVDGRGNLLPTITSSSRMPHDDRGVCSNCHQIAIGSGRGVQAARVQDHGVQVGGRKLQPPAGGLVSF